jgi:hypothetical protein
MAFKNKLLLIEQSQNKIKSDREGIKKLGKKKKRNRHILHNIINSIRLELDTSPYQTILTPGGLWIDYEPDLKKGKVERFYNERVNEPFSKKYVTPNKKVMQMFMDDEFKVKLNDVHMATIEFTKFKEEDINKPDEGEGGKYGNGIGKDWDGNLFKLPPKGIIQARYYGYEPNPEYSNKVHKSTFAYKPGSKQLEEIGKKIANSIYDWKLVSYDTYGSNEANKGKGLVFYVVFYQDFLDKHDTTPAPEDIWTAYFGNKINIHDKSGKSYFVTWDTYKGLHRRTIDGNSKLFTQYLIFDYTYQWTESIEKFGFEPLSKIGGIPLQNIKLYSEKDPEDIVYDGPPDGLLKL